MRVDRFALTANNITYAVMGNQLKYWSLFPAPSGFGIVPVWGFGDGFELRNMYARTNQPGLWFIAGSLAQCRINSKFLALQIKAIEEGILPRAAAGNRLDRDS